MMIPDIQFSLLCDEVRQEINGHFQFLGVFGDGVRVKQFPVRFMRLFVVNRWSSGQGEFRQKTVIMAPDGHTPAITGKEIPIKLADGGKTHTSIEAFMNAEFKEPGTYWVEVSLDDQLRARYPFTILPAPEPAK